MNGDLWVTAPWHQWLAGTGSGPGGGDDNRHWDDSNGPAPAAVVSVVASNEMSGDETLGVARVGAAGSPQPGLFDGIPVAAGDVVVRFTAGPADPLSISPNPDGATTLTWGGNISGATYLPAIYDATGQEVYQWYDPTSAGSAIVSDLTPGARYYPVLDTQTTRPAPYSGTTTLRGYSKLPAYVPPGYVRPASPTDLGRFLTSPQGVSLHWTDEGNNEAGFAIYRSSNPTFDFVATPVDGIGADVTTYVDTPPDTETPWYYYVFAVDSAGRHSTDSADATGGGLALKSVRFGTSAFFGSTNLVHATAIQSVARDSLSGAHPLNQPEWLDANANGSIDGGPARYLDDTIDGTTEHEWPVSFERTLPTEWSYTTANPVFTFAGPRRPTRRRNGKSE